MDQGVRIPNGGSTSQPGFDSSAVNRSTCSMLNKRLSSWSYKHYLKTTKPWILESVNFEKIETAVGFHRFFTKMQGTVHTQFGVGKGISWTIIQLLFTFCNSNKTLYAILPQQAPKCSVPVSIGRIFLALTSLTR